MVITVLAGRFYGLADYSGQIKEMFSTVMLSLGEFLRGADYIGGRPGAAGSLSCRCLYAVAAGGADAGTDVGTDAGTGV